MDWGLISLAFIAFLFGCQYMDAQHKKKNK